jgi:hypothetical protein
MTETIIFDASAFDSLLAFATGLTPGYHEFGEEFFAQLISNAEALGFPADALTSVAKSANALSEFVTDANPDGSPDFNSLLSIKVGSAGNIERIYVPAIFRDGDAIVLKAGKNTIGCGQKGDKLVVGGLTGKIKLKGAKSEDGREYTTITVRLRDASDEDTDRVYVVRALNDPDNDYPEDIVETALEKGESLAQFLCQIGSGAGRFVKLRDMELGDYELAGIIEPEGLKYGRFELMLADGRSVSPNKPLHSQIEGFYNALGGDLNALSDFYAGQLLRILKKTTKGNRVFVDAMLVNPKVNALAAKTTAKPASTTPSIPSAPTTTSTATAQKTTNHAAASTNGQSPVAASVAVADKPTEDNEDTEDNDEFGEVPY